jgi:C1A family cysteine protease
MTIPFEEIAQEVASQGASWEVGETSLTNLLQEERELRLGYTPGPGEPSLIEREGLAQANLQLHAAGIAAAFGRPASYDLRNVGGSNYVTPVKDQGSCGSCVAFGSVATVETTLRVARKNPGLSIDLSEAHLFYCIARAQGRMCSGPNGGWWVPPALDGFKNTGVVDDACYPYTGGDQNCTNLCANWQQRVTKITSWTQFTNPEQMKEWLSSQGALAACFTVYNDFFAYRSGVYRHVTGEQAGGHCVCVVGYDDAAQCWICKNSWNTTWGDQGFFRIAYGECGIDATMWGVTVPQDSSQRVPLYRYWNPNATDHFYTTNWSELGGGRYGWNYEGIQCYVFSAQKSGSVPLYRYWNPSIGDHFYTTNWSELGSGRYGWNYEGIQCYVLPAQASGSVPLYRYWNGSAGDHFYTTNWSELGSGRYGWNYEGIQCYVYTSAASVEPSQMEDIPSSFRVEGPAASSGMTPDKSSFGLTESGGTPASFTLTPESTAPLTGETVGDTGDVPSSFSIETGAAFTQKKGQGVTITINVNP